MAVGSFQVLGLAWIAAWQQRAAHERRKLNGSVKELNVAASALLAAQQPAKGNASN